VLGSIWKVTKRCLDSLTWLKADLQSSEMICVGQHDAWIHLRYKVFES
jgi:hypothetical protein